MVDEVSLSPHAVTVLDHSDDPTTFAVGPVHDPRKLREWTLVLTSMSIAHAVRARAPGEPPGNFILVAASERARALRAIELYEAENRDWPPHRERERLPYARTLAAPLVMSLLVAFFAVTGPVASGSTWFSHGTASSERILHGELWRAVTALTLHADTLHVVGNALSGSIFLSAVNRRLGDGRGPLLVLVSGAVGNLMNAVWYRTAHLSIGASTAVFSAVGVLAATQLVLDRGHVQRTWVERAAPVVGGLALLGTLGASPHSDLLAHLFGLVAGLVIGLATTLRFASGGRSRPWVQAACALSAIAIVVGSWALALNGRV
jgi:rhomboid protease GluP